MKDLHYQIHCIHRKCSKYKNGTQASFIDATLCVHPRHATQPRSRSKEELKLLRKHQLDSTETVEDFWNCMKVSILLFLGSLFLLAKTSFPLLVNSLFQSVFLIMTDLYVSVLVCLG